MEKYRQGSPKPYEIKEWQGNSGLNEGLNLLTTLLCGGAGTAYSAANAYIGVGDSTTSPSAAQTGLQASTNKAWKAMASTYPTYGTSQQVVFKSIFDTTDANFSWQEITVVNASTDAGANLLRGTSAIGTKTSADIWSMTVTVTFY